jgi:hypothetical protein
MIPIPNQGAFTLGDINAIMANMIAGQWTGNTYYVDPVNGLDINNGQSAQAIPGQAGSGAVQSLAAGYALLTDGNNDTLVIVGNGQTSGTARLNVSFTWAKSNCRLLGICAPTRFSQRARIAPTGTTTAFKPFFTISGTGNLFQNIQWFYGFNTGTTAAICMTITGPRNVFQNCAIDGMGDTTSAGDAGSRSLVVSADENLFQDCSIGVDTISRGVANASLEFTNGCARNIFENCVFPFLASAATVLGVKALSGAIDRFQLFNQCLFINAIKSTGVSMTGLGSVGAPTSPAGMLVYKNSTLVGIAEWEQTTKTSVYVDGAAVNSATGVAVNSA